MPLFYIGFVESFFLPFKVSCSARMMSIREFSKECMLKPSNDRVRSCEEIKKKMTTRTRKRMKAFYLI